MAGTVEVGTEFECAYHYRRRGSHGSVMVYSEMPTIRVIALPCLAKSSKIDRIQIRRDAGSRFEGRVEWMLLNYQSRCLLTSAT